MKTNAILASAALLLSGCQTVHEDLGYHGGAVGGVVDRNTDYSALHKKSANGRFQDSEYITNPKHMELYRTIVGAALISKVAAVTIRDPDDANAFVEYLVAVSTDIKNLAGHIQVLQDKSCNSLNADCTDYEFLFESDLPAMEGHMVRLGVAALPQREAANLLENATSGNPLGIATSVWDLGKKSVVAAHNAAALRRSERELFAAIVTMDGKAYPDANVVKAVNDIKKTTAKDFSIDKFKVAPLYLILRDVCATLPVDPKKISNRTARCNEVVWAPTVNRYPAVSAAQ